MSSSSSLRKCAILGGPITAVTWDEDRNDRGFFYYGQGPFLFRCSIFYPVDTKPPLLVFPEGSIHGIRRVEMDDSKTLLLVFGGRRVALVQNGQVCSIIQRDEPVSSSCIEFADWIWQVLCLSQGMVVLGFAHAAIEIGQITPGDPCYACLFSYQRRRIIRNSSNIRSISYCLDIWASSSMLWMAHGNATNEICLWSTTLAKEDAMTTTTGETPTVVTLRGHAGVLHAVRFHASGRFLASTSDDRTVRLWEKQSPSDDSWRLTWTAYGHTARGWDVAFGTLNHHPGVEYTVVLSTGEDGTLRIWDYSCGSALAVLRGHSCPCIWRVATASHGRVLTAGNDGTVALYQLSHVIPDTRFQKQQPEATTSLSLPRRWQSIFAVPMTHVPANDTPSDVLQHANSPLPSRPKKSKKDHQVVVGMKLLHFPWRNDPVSILGPQLILATRGGAVWHLQINTGVWSELEPWRRRSDAMTSLGDGCCLSLHSQRPVGVIGTVTGDIVLFVLRPALDASSSGEEVWPLLLSAQEHRSVQNMKWVQPHVLVSFHVKSVVWWTFPKLKCRPVSSVNGADEISYYNEYTKTTFCKEAKGLAISFAWDAIHSRLVLGDTRGNLTLFDVYDPTLSVVTPTHVLRECHQKEHVTDIVWKNEKTVVSVGNDGRIVYCSVDQNGSMTKLLAVPVAPFTGISMVWNLSSPLSTEIIVGGYYGNLFAVIDVVSGYEILRVDTGGRQRIIDVGRHDTNAAPFPHSWIVATCVNRPDGGNDVEIHGLAPDSCGDHDMRLSIGIPLHGESIFDVHLFPIDSSHQMVAVLTGSEDCSARISLYRGEQFLYSKLLPLQVSGIRAVRSCRYNSNSTIVVMGGKCFVDLYLVPDIDSDEIVDDFEIRFLGSCRPVEKLLIDQRINCIECATFFAVANEPTVVAISGDSSGSCYLYTFSGNFSSSGRLFYRSARPILCMEILQHRDWSVVAVGETSGDVAVLILNHKVLCNKILEEPQTPLLRYKAHSMGTNSLSLRLVDDVLDGNCMVRVGSCGDDQAVCCTDIELVTDDTREIIDVNVRKTCKIQNAAVSALKGIEFIDNVHFIVTGYDQRLTLWRLSVHYNWIKVDDAPIDIGDVNCLAQCDVRYGQHVIAVGGAGVEMVSLSL